MGASSLGGGCSLKGNPGHSPLLLRGFLWTEGPQRRSRPAVSRVGEVMEEGGKLRALCLEVELRVLGVSQGQ